MKLPPATLAVVVLAAAAGAAPGAFELSREALGRGEAWRLLTGALAHYSPFHFVVDAAPLLLIGSLYEREVGSRRWAAMLCAGSVAVSTAFLCAEDGPVYRGLSGLDWTALAAAIAIEARRRPALAAAVGLLCAARLAHAHFTQSAFFPIPGGDTGVPSVTAHPVGALVGFLYTVRHVARLRDRRRRPDARGGGEGAADRGAREGEAVAESAAGGDLHVAGDDADGTPALEARHRGQRLALPRHR